MKYLTDCKKIETAIKRAKERLEGIAKRKGLYENFGDQEARLIEKHFIDMTDYSMEMNQRRKALQRFRSWASSYTPHGSW